ncbi:TPA: hypothetical protein N0F65_004299 [Lagenidium giganteum]|uniref:Anaphase-promoting complex subunit 10 n=1 Tax=Lagenidium giganteum TaxID=4803 RepID=A0AAV2ZD27_9STRA|nr:TPA: hypothetical protein N0F65_004299 [Lagenidium giganteum]
MMQEAELGREIGDEAVWSLSTAKPGNGVEQLRDNNMDTYWQSDGSQPHLINIQFMRKTAIREVALYLDYKLDESYTPKKLSIRTGSTVQDLREILTQNIVEPTGWIAIPLAGDDEEASLRTFFLQIAIVAMHQNGRDTHIRQVRIYAPCEPTALDRSVPEYSTEQFWSFASIR